MKKNKNFLLVIIIGLTFYNIGMIVILNNKTDQNFKLTNNNNFLTTKEKRKLIIFLDEMIGYGAINSKSKYGKKALESYQNTLKIMVLNYLKMLLVFIQIQFNQFLIH